MFDVQISPILEYASEVWYTGKEVREIENVHLSYLKSTLRVKETSCTNAIYAECGRVPVIIKQKFQVLKYWERMLKLNKDHIVKRSYECLRQLCDLGQTNWCTHVQNI